MYEEIGARENIRGVGDILREGVKSISEEPGVYAFWWTNPVSELMAANRQISLKGPSGQYVEVKFENWRPDAVPYLCLYVGKSTNISKRFSMHILNRKKCRLHKPCPGNRKAKRYSTSCQLRHGIEHVFPECEEPLKLIQKSVGFSFREISSENAVAERFFEEDRLIGTLRPWFNIDSER